MTADARTRRRRLWLYIALPGLPLLLLLAAWLAGGLDAALALWTLWGILGATVGGVIGGWVMDRFLHRGRNGFEQFIGFAAGSAIGVITIGTLYLVHIRGPMSTIGTLSRALEQVLIFLAFLTGQAEGILLSSRRGT